MTPTQTSTDFDLQVIDDLTFENTYSNRIQLKYVLALKLFGRVKILVITCWTYNKENKREDLMPAIKAFFKTILAGEEGRLVQVPSSCTVRVPTWKEEWTSLGIYEPPLGDK